MPGRGGWDKPPPALLQLDVAASEKRWNDQNADLPLEPEEGKAYQVPTTNTPLVWIDAGDFEMGVPEWCLDAWHDASESGKLQIDPFVAFRSGENVASCGQVPGSGGERGI